MQQMLSAIAGGLAMPLALGLLALHYLDVRQPDKWFSAPAGLGLVSIVPAELIEHWVGNIIRKVIPDLHPEAIHRTLSGLWQDDALSANLLIGSVGAALPEELIVGILFFSWLCTRPRIEREGASTIIFAGAVTALSFAALENVYFLTRLGLSSNLIVMRSIFSTPVHFAAGLGLGVFGAIGIKSEVPSAKRAWMIGGTALAVAGHSVYDVIVLSATSLERLGLLSRPQPILAAVTALALSVSIILVPSVVFYRRVVFSRDP